MRGPARWVPALAWMAVIWVLSAQTGQTLDPVWPNPPDKLLHLVEYSVLGLALGYALGAGRRGMLAAVALGAAWGGLDEWHQSFVADRTASVLDWLVDAAGVALGVTALRAWRRRKGRA